MGALRRPFSLVAKRVEKQTPDEMSALALAEQGRYAEAAAAFERLLVREPEQWRHRYNLGWACLHAERYREAVECFEALAVRFQDMATVWLGAGLGLFRLGFFDQAASALRRARELEPGLVEAPIFEARALLERGAADEAERVLELLGRSPKLAPDLVNEYALALIGLKRYAAARALLEEALREAPENPLLLTNLAQLCERRNEIDAAWDLLQRVPALDGYGRLLQARLLRRRGKLTEALAKLDTLERDLSDRNAALAAEISFERGHCLDRMGRYAEAFAAFAHGNAIDRQAFSRPDQKSGLEASSWWRDRPQLDAAVIAAQLPGRSTPQAPIFMVGFPRSGTTLLDNILDAHPQLQVAEEKTFLQPVVQRLAQKPGGYPLAIAGLDESEAEALRTLYWHEVQRLVGPRYADRRLVDKNPFNFLYAHLIARLFPRAQWLFVVRHPCDVAISCFMQRLQYTELTRGFQDLREIALLYRETIGQWLNQRRRLPLRCLDVRYEDLVTNPERETRRLLEFLQLPWVPQVLEPETRARRRWVTTPSYSQVSQPIYDSAVGRWRHYRPWLEAVIDIVGPVAHELGYSVAE